MLSFMPVLYALKCVFQLRELREQAEKNDGSAEYARSELRTYRKKVEDMTAQMDRLRGQVGSDS